MYSPEITFIDRYPSEVARIERLALEILIDYSEKVKSTYCSSNPYFRNC